MPAAFAILVGCQLAGAWLSHALHLPLPGALVGMVLLTMALVAGVPGGMEGRRGVQDTGREGPAADCRVVLAAPRRTPPGSALARVQASLGRTASGLIGCMGLLFVPAGVGIVAQMDVLRAAWLPLAAGLVVSTLLGLAVTGVVMQHFCRVSERAR